MKFSLFLLAAGLAQCALFGGVELPLTNPPAPFAERKTAGNEAKSAPVFDAAGKRLVFGSKVLQIFPSGYLSFLDSGREISKIYFYGFTPYSSWISNQNSNIIVPHAYGRNLGVDSFETDAAGKTFTVKGKIPYQKKGEKELTGSYVFTVKLLPTGKASIRLELNKPAGRLKDGGMRIMWVTPKAVKYLADRKEYVFPADQIKQNHHWRVKEIRMLTERPSETFALQPKCFMSVYARKGNLLALHPHPNKKNPDSEVIEVELDPLNWGKKAASGAVDLRAAEDLDPETPGSRNLLHNPYLAQGLNHIGAHHQLFPWRGTVQTHLSSDRPNFGEHCLAFDKGENLYLPPVSLAPGEYTFSFYARGGEKSVVNVSVWNHGLRNYVKPARFGIGKEWKRYQTSFKLDRATGLRMQLIVRPKGTLYLDGFQLEAGNKATEFDASPATSRLLTSAADDFIRRGDPIRARLRLSTLKDSVSGKLTASVLDVFGTELFRKEAPFKFGRQEHPEIPLELDGKIPDGIHRVKVEFQVGDKRYTEYFRFSVMPFFANRHKLKNFFATNYNGGSVYDDVYPGYENYIRRKMYLGSGSDVHQCYPTKAMDELFRKYNYEWLDASIGARNGAAFIKKSFPGLDPKPGYIYYYYSWAPSRLYWWSHYKESALLADHRLVGGWSPEFRRKVVETAEFLVKKSSPRRIYEMGSEWPPDIKNDPHYVDLVLAVREGVKKVYPQAMFCEAGSYNMDAGGGVREIDGLLTRLKGKMPIELIHTHTYTKDILALEPNFKALVDVVENKHGLKNMKYYFGEGMHYGPYEIPAWGLESANWDGLGWATAVPLSYDFGWTEKHSAAYFMRSWLIFLTKIDQVLAANSAMCNRPGNFALDVQFRPRVAQKIPNTLSMLLGNAKRFVKDISFAQHVKCLVWEDEKGRPIAAVWYQEPAADHGVKQGPWASAKLPVGTEIFDMMGAKRTPRADGQFPVSVFPFFLRGKAESFDAFVNALANAELVGGTSLPFKASAEPLSASEANLKLTNFKARAITAEVACGNKKTTVKLLPQGTASVKVPLSRPLPFDRIAEAGLSCTVSSGGKQLKVTDVFPGMSVKRFDGDWKKIPSFAIRNKSGKNNFPSSDFSACGQLAWDRKNLYIRIEVTDDKFVHTEYPNPERRWNNDSLQIFIDTRCSARKKNLRTFDDDDYMYNVHPSADGKSAHVFRYRVPDMQLTEGITAPKEQTIADDIPVKFQRTKNGYIYELAIQARYLMPARLEPGYAMGFALALNDRDDGKSVKQSLTTTKEGTAPYNRPYLYPVIVLSDK